jgi:hypothetical protein
VTNVEPVRVKVYGLFSRTRRRYLIDAAIGTIFGLFLLVAWWLGWPILRQRLATLTLPPLLQVTVAVLDATPWILLGAAVYKGMEVLLVWRLFARKESLLSPRGRGVGGFQG